MKNSRIFVCRIIAELKKLAKNTHRTKLSLEIRKDFSWFKLFLKTFNGIELIEHIKTADLVVNTTPVGMKQNPNIKQQLSDMPLGKDIWNNLKKIGRFSNRQFQTNKEKN